MQGLLIHFFTPSTAWFPLHPIAIAASTTTLPPPTSPACKLHHHAHVQAAFGVSSSNPTWLARQQPPVHAAPYRNRQGHSMLLLQSCQSRLTANLAPNRSLSLLLPSIVGSVFSPFASLSLQHEARQPFL